jgi:hypothetical protein
LIPEDLLSKSPMIPLSDQCLLQYPLFSSLLIQPTNGMVIFQNGLGFYHLEIGPSHCMVV